ncbi:uncharacterized protein LOC113378629 [Ctenocephalides felis]|uniref:uncharacterized protein LOC113378629 n=1 Tax=Ctenocephalides felis TaxID=7515 RepID=UPI000E6E1A74|nr:uncharacterized protein LOC113378629 [Ctenocephalides felis]
MSEEISVCSREHSIKISNMHNHDVVSNSVILLRGTVRNTSTCNNSIIINHYHNGEIIQTFMCNVHNSVFKCLVQLKLSINHFELKYCSNTINCNVDYKVISTVHTVAPVLIICDNHDGTISAPDEYSKSLESSRSRLMLAVQLMQYFFAEKVYEYTNAHKTFNIEYEDDLPKIYVHKSKLDVNLANEMNEIELWQYFAKELMMSKLSSPKRKFLAVITNTEYKSSDATSLCYDDIKKLTNCYASVGKGNLALFGNPFFYTWPVEISEVQNRFQDNVLESFITQNKEVDPVIKTIGGCYSFSFGAALHELAHIFDLGHTQYGLMGREYFNIDKVFSFGRYDLNPQAPYSDLNTSNDDNKSMSCNRKSFTVFKKPVKPQVTQFAKIDKGCAYILFLHKWFNNHAETKEAFSYDFSSNELFTANCLGVVQLRQLESELVAYSFLADSETYKWVRPAEFRNKSMYLLAIDVFGNTFNCITTR